MARLLDRQMAQQQEALTEVRRSAVGSGDRSEKVRTYNYPEGRITDHRIDFKYYKLPQFVEAGDLDPVIDRLIAWGQGNHLSEPPQGAKRNSRQPGPSAARDGTGSPGGGPRSPTAAPRR